MSPAAHAGPGKRERQQAIRELVARQPVGSQEELAEQLRERSFPVTQATVSRDIAELGLVKVARGDRHVYVSPEDLAAPPHTDDHLRRLLDDLPVTIGRSGLILVLVSTPGHRAACSARPSTMRRVQEQEGTLAGDNTLLVLFRDEARLERWLTWFRSLQRLSITGSGLDGAERQQRPRGELSMNKVVLAYSGGLDTSVAVAWLREQYDAEVVTLTVDVGGGSLREGVERRALSAGASRAYVVDARERFVTDFVWPHLQANALYQGVYPLATALARPLIAQLLVEVARRERRRRRRPRLHRQGQRPGPLRCRDPRPRPGPPGDRADAGRHGPLARAGDRLRASSAASRSRSPKDRAYSIDANLWGRSIEAGVLEDPWAAPPADVYEWTVDPSAAPDAVELDDRLRGRHPGLDRRRVAAAGRPGRPAPRPRRRATASGRIDHVEDRLVGIKSREIYEAPAATILHRAHRALEGMTLSKDTLRFNRTVADELAQLDLRRPLVQRPPPRPARLRRVVAARRLGRGPGPARSRQRERRRPPEPAVAVREEPRDVRRGRRVRPPQRGRVHRDLRAAAPHRGRAPRRGRQALRRCLDLDRAAARRAADHGDVPASPRRRPPEQPLEFRTASRTQGSGRAKPLPRSIPAAAARARVPPRVRPARDPGARLGRADEHRHRAHDGRAQRRRVLAVPHGPRGRPADARRHERPRSQPRRQGLARGRRGHHGHGRGAAAAARGARRPRGSAVQMGPRLRPPGHHRRCCRCR